MAEEIKTVRDDGAVVIVDREACIGAATCITIAGDVFELDKEQKAVAIDVNATDLDTILESARSCPVDAIKVIDQEGKTLWPASAS